MWQTLDSKTANKHKCWLGPQGCALCWQNEKSSRTRHENKSPAKHLSELFGSFPYINPPIAACAAIQSVCTRSGEKRNVPFIKYNERFDLNRTEDRKTGVCVGWGWGRKWGHKKSRPGHKNELWKDKNKRWEADNGDDKNYSMAANKEETQLRESSVNGAMCRFVNMGSLPT